MNHVTNFKITSKQDGLELGVTTVVPDTEIKGIIQIAHGMSEHRQRYLAFMQYCAAQGFVCVIHDHRGHGESIRSKQDYGYLYEHGADYIVEDLFQVTLFIKEQYPKLPLFLLGHSMGSLIVRVFIKKHDDAINGLIVCGSPSYNKMVGIAKRLTVLIGTFKNDHYRSNMLQQMTFGSHNKKFRPAASKNDWLCTVKQEVEKYDLDEACGFVFTVNGFYNLFVIMQQTYSKTGWAIKNKNLPVLFIAGSEDPCITDKTHFKNAQQHLVNVGYCNVTSKMYEGKRHEILNEDIKQQVYQDIIDWIDTLQ